MIDAERALSYRALKAYYFERVKFDIKTKFNLYLFVGFPLLHNEFTFTFKLIIIQFQNSVSEINLYKTGLKLEYYILYKSVFGFEHYLSIVRHEMLIIV